LLEADGLAYLNRATARRHTVRPGSRSAPTTAVPWVPGRGPGGDVRCRSRIAWLTGCARLTGYAGPGQRGRRRQGCAACAGLWATSGGHDGMPVRARPRHQSIAATASAATIATTPASTDIDTAARKLPPVEPSAA
jgi:hypothetical protein